MINTTRVLQVIDSLVLRYHCVDSYTYNIETKRDNTVLLSYINFIQLPLVSRVNTHRSTNSHIMPYCRPLAIPSLSSFVCCTGGLGAGWLCEKLPETTGCCCCALRKYSFTSCTSLSVKGMSVGCRRIIIKSRVEGSTQ